MIVEQDWGFHFWCGAWELFPSTARNTCKPCALRRLKSANSVPIFHFTIDLGVLDVGDDFQNSNEVYEAIGEVLHEVAANKGEDEIRYFQLFASKSHNILYSYLLFRKLCQQLLTVLKPDLVDGQQNGVHSSYNGGERKLLNNPVMMSDAASFMKENDGEAPAASIWNKPKGEDMVSEFCKCFHKPIVKQTFVCRKLTPGN